MHVGETPKEEGQNNDELDAGSIFGIVIACIVTALVILICIIAAIVTVRRDRKKRTGKAEFKSETPDPLSRYDLMHIHI